MLYLFHGRHLATGGDNHRGCLSYKKL
ncbi:hypothetical protein bas59_0126 [Escherichia phage EduardKellenberger]|uniref:Uncharacterized protein n=1 Tax=Escherichia phage EduardKellenberger TaxID=2852031 RepID=A0ABX8SPZ3_9CAUD|nr:hypothetical protein bas59_0126 [Escherichia phage EduardKellenberger]